MKPFQVPEMTIEVGKLEAAASQIEDAIQAIERGNLIAAITLAGAAEGMLPPRPGGAMFDRMKTIPPEYEHLADAWVPAINWDRNWFKHETPELPDRLEIQTDDAAFMIVRALSKLPTVWWSTSMAAFKGWYLDRIASLRTEEKA